MNTHVGLTFLSVQCVFMFACPLLGKQQEQWLGGGGKQHGYHTTSLRWLQVAVVCIVFVVSQWLWDVFLTCMYLLLPVHDCEMSSLSVCSLSCYRIATARCPPLLRHCTWIWYSQVTDSHVWKTSCTCRKSAHTSTCTATLFPCFESKCVGLISVRLACLSVYILNFILFFYYVSLFLFSCHGPCAPMEKWHIKEYIIVIIIIKCSQQL